MAQQMRQAASFDDEMQAMEPECSRLEWAREWAWAGARLCSSMLQRWLNVCEIGAEEIFFALTMLRSFSGVNLETVPAGQEAAALNSRSLFGERDSARETDSAEMAWSQPKAAISWRTPWLYLVLVLLVWLLLF